MLTWQRDVVVAVACRSRSAQLLVLVLVLVGDGLSSLSFHAPISDQNLSSLFLNEFVVDASITCCGNEFQLLLYIGPGYYLDG